MTTAPETNIANDKPEAVLQQAAGEPEACSQTQIIETSEGLDLEQRCQKAEEEAKSLFDRLLRVSAEFDNYKKRNAREMEEFRKYANETILSELLFVVDNLERAIDAGERSVGKDHELLKGVEMTLKELMRIFEKFSVRPVESVGKAFDPAFHQAVMQEPSEQFPENTVVKEFQKGYLLHDRLLRPAMVAVSCGSKS
ncbi:MAG: nucleotide exchange factor GrpE [Thermodesulfobacteriota bacterium]